MDNSQPAINTVEQPHETPSYSTVPSPRRVKMRWWILGGVVVTLLILVGFTAYLLMSQKLSPSGVICTADAKKCPDGSYVARIPPKCDFAPCLTPDLYTEGNRSATAGWKIYRNENLRYEFKYPPNPLEPMRTESDTAFIIGYFLDGGNPNNLLDVQDPDKTYWITLGYISQAQLNVMGITYCGAYPSDTSRCESITIGGQTSTADWNIPVEYTKINDNGKKEKATQIRASVWIPHPKGGIVTFELQPVAPKSKETLYKILSTFKFLD